MRTGPSRVTILLLRIFLGLYIAGRLLQLDADRLPTLLIVLFHVIPPAAFAWIHGRVVYGVKGILIFSALCLGIGGAAESLSLRTGFPFGHYYFTEVMGPKVYGLPYLLVLAYLGIGYCSWCLSLVMLRRFGEPMKGRQLITIPMLASLVMLAWDVSMEADWSTVDHAWVWLQGGRFFGVPLGNFAGWYLTAYLIFLTFALYSSRSYFTTQRPQAPSFWKYAVLFYGVCAFGNLLIPAQPMAPPIVVDGAGRAWKTVAILLTDCLTSVLLMGSFAVFSWRRLQRYS